MLYRSVGNRCAFNLDTLGAALTHDEIFSVLHRKGFTLVDVDMLALARSCIGFSVWRGGVDPLMAPGVVDCSSFTMWLYARRGIELPRLTIQQYGEGEPASHDALVAGDLVFTTGFINRYDHDPADAVGHVGFATGEGTVIHAANTERGVVEESLADFFDGNVRGARRLIPMGEKVCTFRVPPERNRAPVRSDNFRWMLLGTLPRSVTK